MSTEEYRQQVLSILFAKTNAKGTARFDKSSAKELLDQLSDEGLGEGILFNTSEDVAEILSEVGTL